MPAVCGLKFCTGFPVQEIHAGNPREAEELLGRYNITWHSRRSCKDNTCKKEAKNSRPFTNASGKRYTDRKMVLS